MAATVEGDELVFRYRDPLRVLRGVRLQQDVRLPDDQLGFERSGGEWVLRVPRPDVDRVEYSFELQLADGTSSWVIDPDNPERAGGAFGGTSVLLMPEYAAPDWTCADPPRGPRRELSLATRGLEHDVPAVLWSAAGLGERAEVPLLVVHDGPEYGALGGRSTPSTTPTPAPTCRSRRCTTTSHGR